MKKDTKIKCKPFGGATKAIVVDLLGNPKYRDDILNNRPEFKRILMEKLPEFNNKNYKWIYEGIKKEGDTEKFVDHLIEIQKNCIKADLLKKEKASKYRK